MKCKNCGEKNVEINKPCPKCGHVNKQPLWEKILIIITVAFITTIIEMVFKSLH